MKAFVPICLYSNGFFLAKEHVQSFLQYYINYDEILFVIVDKLYGHNLLIKNKVLTIETARMAYEKRGQDIFYLIRNCVRKHVTMKKPATNYVIKYWNEIADSNEYLYLKDKIIYEFDNNSNLKSHSEKFIEENLIRMINRIDDDKKDLERDYLFSEIAMSIYLTEFCGFTDEIWEKKQLDSLQDPIEVLYQEEPEILKKIIGKNNYHRNQLFLSLS